MARRKKGYREKEIDGVIYYFSDYSKFVTPHLSKIEAHVAARREALVESEAEQPKKAAPKKAVSAKAAQNEAVITEQPEAESDPASEDKEK